MGDGEGRGDVEGRGDREGREDSEGQDIERSGEIERVVKMGGDMARGRERGGRLEGTLRTRKEDGGIKMVKEGRY